MGGKPPGNIDALLLAAGECHRREVPQALGNGEARQQLAGAVQRKVFADAAFEQGFRDDQFCRNPRYDPQELRHISDRSLPDVQHQVGWGGNHILRAAVMADEDRTRAGAVRAIDELEE